MTCVQLKLEAISPAHSARLSYSRCISINVLARVEAIAEAVVEIIMEHEIELGALLILKSTREEHLIDDKVLINQLVRVVQVLFYQVGAEVLVDGRHIVVDSVVIVKLIDCAVVGEILNVLACIEKIEMVEITKSNQWN